MINHIYKLPEIDFIGGSTADLSFNVLTDRVIKDPVSLEGWEADFSIISFMNKTGEPIVSKAMTITSGYDEEYTNVMYVRLDAADTYGLCGKYVYQISAKTPDDYSGRGADLIIRQGLITIHSNINKQFAVE